MSQFYRNLILIGAESSGKTSFRYAVKHGKAWNTSPTLGIVLERMKHKGHNIQIVDVGGNGCCHRTLQNLPNFHGPGSILLFFYDFANQEADASLDLLRLHLQEAVKGGTRFAWVVLNRQKAVTDLKDAAIEFISTAFNNVLQEFDGKVLHEIYHLEGDNLPSECREERLMEYIYARLERDKQFIPIDLEAERKKRWQAEEVSAQLHTNALETTWKQQTHMNSMRYLYRVVVNNCNMNASIFDLADRAKQQQPLEMDRIAIIFWINQIQQAIRQYRAKNPGISNIQNAFDDISVAYSTLLAPDAIKSSYSQVSLASQESQRYWRLPDQRGLPCFGVDILNCKPCRLGYHSDCLPSQESDRLPRFAYAVVKAYLTGPTIRRNWVVDQALSALQASTIRQRSQGAKVINYAHIKAVTKIAPNAWKEFYTPSLWVSVGARVRFMQPDRKPLPPGIMNSAPWVTSMTKELKEKITNSGHVPELPPDEELAFKIAVALYIAGRPAPLDPATSHPHLLFMILQQAVGGKSVGEILDDFDQQVSCSDRERATFWVKKVVQSVASDRDQYPAKMAEKYENGKETFRVMLQGHPFLVHEGLFEVEANQKQIESKVAAEMRAEEPVAFVGMEQADWESDSSVSEASQPEQKQAFDVTPLNSERVVFSKTIEFEQDLKDEAEWEMVEP
ncbi:hypothetical protein BT63DRAFT_417003 [Microthyrium microscopicum]|uniref:Uncharacterized protein n=1 Tax=Microthyrium microscopicum TaxID=703497 RepID=A0A6A6U3A8_9PEZI|nr:hypothetical protein BT63DRAFT_417003 [Microthyrium microscopicum]